MISFPVESTGSTLDGRKITNAPNRTYTGWEGGRELEIEVGAGDGVAVSWCFRYLWPRH